MTFNFGGIRSFFTGIGGIVGRMVQLHGDEKREKEEYETDDHTWTYLKPGDPNEHTFTGTPEEFRWFRLERPEWFPK